MENIEFLIVTKSVLPNNLTIKSEAGQSELETNKKEIEIKNRNREMMLREVKRIYSK
jgi:hypothetical protein